MARATLRWLDHRVTLEASEDLLQEAVALLSGFAPELHAGDGPSPEIVAGEKDDADTLEYAVIRHLLEQDQRHIHLHAAAAEITAGEGPGRALLIVGPSGAGKSTMASTFMAAGHRIFGDDVVALGGEGLVAFPRMVKVDNDATLLDPGPGGWWAEGPARVAGIVAAEWREGAETSLTPVDAAEALRLLLDGVHSTTRDPEGGVDLLTALAASVPAAHVVYGEASQALRAVADWLA